MFVDKPVMKSAEENQVVQVGGTTVATVLPEPVMAGIGESRISRNQPSTVSTHGGRYRPHKRSVLIGYFGDPSPTLGGPVGIALDLYELSTVRCGDFLGIFLGVSKSGFHAFVHEFLGLVE